MKMHAAKRRLLLGASVALLAGAPAVGWAQAAHPQDAEVETVVVTALKRAEDIQDVPMAVSAVSGAVLERRGVTSVAELSKFLPSVAITQSNNNRNSTIFIRGIGTSGTNPGIEPSVGIFLDGVYLAAAGPIQVNLQDIAAVEVLRGPQGTLYGRNTPVGAINLTTRAPQDKFESMLNLEAGNYGEWRVGGYVGGGIAPDLAGRLSFWLADREGYETNLSTGSDVNGQSQKGVRGRLRWQPGGKLDINAIGYWASIKAKCCTPDQIDPTSPTGIATAGFLAASAAAGRPFRNFTSGDHVVDDDYEGRNDTTTYGASVQADLELGAGHTLTSITAWNGYDDYITQLAADALPLDITRGFQRLVNDVYSEEIRILSPKDQRFSYIVGLYLFREHMAYDTQTNVGATPTRVFAGNTRAVPGEFNHFYFRQRTNNAALFGQGTLNLTDSLRINGGLRYSYDDKRAFLASVDSPGASAGFRSGFPANIVGDVNRDETKLTWSIGVQYDVAPSVMVYALASTGYKTGGFNARAAPVNTPIAFDAENATNYEAGVKSTLFGRKLVLNADVYRLVLKGFQDSALNPLTGSGFIVANAGDRRVDGVEAEAQWRPFTELGVNASVSYMDGVFTNYSAGQCYGGQVANGTRPGTCNYNGLTPAQNPKWQWSLAAQWSHDLSATDLALFVNADVSYVGDQLLTTTLDPRSFQAAVTLVGARAGVESQDGRWRLSVWGKNLTDESYYLVDSPQPVAFLIGAGGTAAANGFVGWYAPPRTYGVELQLRF